MFLIPLFTDIYNTSIYPVWETIRTLWYVVVDNKTISCRTVVIMIEMKGVTQNYFGSQERRWVFSVFAFYFS